MQDVRQDEAKLDETKHVLVTCSEVDLGRLGGDFFGQVIPAGELAALDLARKTATSRGTCRGSHPTRWLARRAAT